MIASVAYTDPFGLCYDKQTKEARACKVTWSEANHSNRNVSTATMRMVQGIADRANVDLTLSSGRRQGSCAASLHNCGTAVDISAINGHDIGQMINGVGVTNPSAMPFVNQVQSVMKTMPDIRENYGPAGLFESKSASGGAQVQIYDDALQNAHNDHVHAGGQRYLQDEDTGP